MEHQQSTINKKKKKKTRWDERLLHITTITRAGVQPGKRPQILMSDLGCRISDAGSRTVGCRLSDEV